MEKAHIDVDPNLKAGVENILSELDLTASDAVNLFFKQIMSIGGLPEMKVSRFDYEAFDGDGEEELYKKLMEGEADIKAGRVKTLEEVSASMMAVINKYKRV